jgi:hypothetical protein
VVVTDGGAPPVAPRNRPSTFTTCFRAAAAAANAAVTLQEGILEQLWGEHIHLGYYDEDERKKGAFRKDFIQVLQYIVLKDIIKYNTCCRPVQP